MAVLATLLDVGSDEEASACGCDPNLRAGRLHVDADSCPGDGDLDGSPACRATLVDALGGRDVEGVRTERTGLARDYRESTVSLLVAAGRFSEAAAFHDERVAALARRDPVTAAREADGRADAIGDLGETTGLVAAAADFDTSAGYRAFTGPTVSRWRVDPAVPEAATLTRARDLETGGTARLYTTDDLPRYVLEPLESKLDQAALSTLDRAHEYLAEGGADRGVAAPGRAVRAVAGSEAPVEPIARVLRKHTRGFGLLSDLFADPPVSDVFVTAPAAANPIRVTLDGDAVVTNVRLTDRGVRALASRFRRTSGRAFSRATPTLDATATVADRRVRVAGVTAPASPGEAFAFRAHDRRAWTLAALVANGTVSALAAGLISVAVGRGCAILVAGPRGAGKTTLLGAMLWELPASVRTVVIEDAPELPVQALQARGRDVQALRAAAGESEIGPAEALRTALRLGDGALVVGEVRGREADVLYEAMRVGANSEAVLGTIHGTDGAAVRDRVVNDLGVPASSFAATDAVVSLEFDGTVAGKTRRVRAVEEVRSGSGSFADLLGRDGNGLEPTGRLRRGNSELLATLTAPSETYADVLAAVEERRDRLRSLAKTGCTGPPSDGDPGDQP
ncbi:MAG: ATPase, T2SS/T4P/T4SS family [Haloarculaceae archaeon]